MRWSLLVVAVSAAACTSSTASGPPPAPTPAPAVAPTPGAAPTRAAAPVGELLSTRQILARMEASPVKYVVRPLEECDVAESRIAATLWPRRAPEFQFPVVRPEPDGQVSV